MGRSTRSSRSPQTSARCHRRSLTALDAAIKTADFEAIRAVAFTGECPVNFDGQEVIYEFAAPSGVERIASCETEVDPDHPLFAAVDAALAAVETGG